jgi:UDP-N-acetylglucosamine acyltransferase
LHRAYRYLLAAKMNTSQALEKLKSEDASEDVKYLIEFIEKSERGILK